MTSEIRTNSLKSRAGLSTVTLTDSGPMFSGITTFVDNSTFSVGTGGTIHAPATNTLNIGVNNTESLRIDSNSNVKIAGVCTATHFYGSGANLTSLPAQATIANNADNRVITGGSGVNLNGESGLLFDGTQLQIGGDSGFSGTWGLEVYNTSSNEGTALIGGLQGAQLQIRDLGSSECVKIAANGQASIQSLKAGDPMVFFTTPSGGSVTERLRIESGGSVGISSAIHHIGDTDTEFGFPSNDTFLLKIAGSSRIYTHSSEPIWHRRDVSAGVSTQTLLLNYNNASGSGCALAFAPSTNYTSRHSSIEVVNEGNNNMHMKFKVTDASDNAHALERMRITKDGEVLIGSTAAYSAGYTQVTVGNNTIQNTGITIASSASNGYSRIHFADNTSGSASYAGWITYSHAEDALLFATNGSGTDKARLTSAGNLVIGHTSGNNKLQIGNTGHSGYAIAANSPSYGAVIQVGDGATPGTAAALWIRNLNNGGGTTACLRVQADGTTHFGDQTSVGKYNDGVSGASWYDAKDSWQQGQQSSIGWSMMYMNKIGSGDNRLIQFNSSGSNIGYINRSGSNVAYLTSSDYRLKKDVVALPNGIERVKQLRPVAFKWIQDNSDMEGFLAHEAQEICPYAVSGTKDEVALEDHGDRKKGDMINQCVDYGEFTPLLTAAIKELIAKVETLEQENIALRARVTNLEGN